MKKRLACLALLIVLLCSVLLPAQALTSLNTYASARFDRSYPVYSGPGEYYYRANSGKATYGGGVARVYGVTGDWVMIGYGLSGGAYRIGYIPSEAMAGISDIKGNINYSLAFSSTTMWTTEKCSLTDDPIINNASIYSIPSGTQVTALGSMGTNWTYVEVMGSSSLIRGFVRTRYLTDGSAPAPTAIPTPRPTATPRPTTAPYYPYYPTQAPTQYPYYPYYPTQAPTQNPYYPSYSDGTLLSSLTHNCPNTGIMLPEYFSPYHTTYVLTVADWVSRVTFSPIAQNPYATITVNGQNVRSGQTSQVISMTDNPQAVTIKVSYGSASTTYTIYLQRRPSEKRTKVSSGYISRIYMKNNEWRLDADMVTMKYAGEDYINGNISTFSNSGRDSYDYVIHPNCSFYYGTKANCYRARNVQEFLSNYLRYGSSMYTFVYIESEIVAIFPYGADY
ncbi:MAG: cadherin-like beta sandwich domain-containing protein [Clostridia bacterium]|nr:cadherin-like beta sandwich domain-containing protein [Clostridia bacterium]